MSECCAESNLSRMSWAKWGLGGLFALYVFLACAVVYVWRGSLLTFEVSMKSTENGTAQLYFDAGKGYQDEDSCRINIRRSAVFIPYSFHIPPGIHRWKMRFDPIDRLATIEIRAARIVDNLGGVVVRIPPRSFTPWNQVKTYNVSIDESGFVIVAGGPDPNLMVDVDPRPVRRHITVVYVIAALSFPLLVLVGMYLVRLLVPVFSLGDMFYTMAMAIAVSVPVFLWHVGNSSSYYLRAEVNSSVPGIIRLLYDRGNGMRSQDSAEARINHDGKYRKILLKFPEGRYTAFRLDPMRKKAVLSVVNAGIIDAAGRNVVSIPPDSFKPIRMRCDVDKGRHRVDLITGNYIDEPEVRLAIEAPMVLRADGRRMVWGLWLMMPFIVILSGAIVWMTVRIHEISPRVSRIITAYGWLVACVLFVVSVLTLAWLVPLNRDDYGSYCMMGASPSAVAFNAQDGLDRSGGYLHHIWTYYMGGGGRLLGMISVVVFFKSLVFLPVFKLLHGIALCVLGVLLVQVFDRSGRVLEWKARDTWMINVKTMLVIVVSLVLALRSFVAECAFWLTGGIAYVGLMVASLLWLLILKRGWLMHREGWVTGVIWFLASLIVGASHEQLGLVVPLVFAIMVLADNKSWLSQDYRRRGIRSSIAVLGSCGICFGVLALMLSPGNFQRVRMASPVVWNVFAIASNYLQIVVKFSSVAGWVLGLGAVAGLIIALDSIRRFNDKEWNIRTLFVDSMLSTIYAAISMAPLSAVPAFAVNRTLFFPSCFMYLTGLFGAIAIAIWVSRLIGKHAYVLEATRMETLLAVGLLGIWFYVFVGEVKLGYRYYVEMDIRHRYLMNLLNRGEDVKVDPIDSPAPQMLALPDIMKDPEYWANKYMAQYYGLRSIGLR